MGKCGNYSSRKDRQVFSSLLCKGATLSQTGTDSRCLVTFTVDCVAGNDPNLIGLRTQTLSLTVCATFSYRASANLHSNERFQKHENTQRHGMRFSDESLPSNSHEDTSEGSTTLARVLSSAKNLT